MDNMNTATMDKKMSQNDASDVKQDLRFDDGVLQKIVGKTASEIEGVIDLQGNLFSDMTDMFRKTDNLKKGVSVDVEDNEKVSVELDAVMKYGADAPAIFDKITDAIEKNMDEMTGLQLTEVKLTVTDMLTDEEIKANKDIRHGQLHFSQLKAGHLVHIFLNRIGNFVKNRRCIRAVLHHGL